MGWKEKTPTKITFDESMLDQELVGKVTTVGRAGRLNVNTYTMLTEEGDLISFLGNTVLDKVLSDELGSLVSIKYTGDVKTSGGFKVKQFEVKVWEEDEAPVARMPEEAPAPAVKKKSKR
jgi:hypothetical protein